MHDEFDDLCQCLRLLVSMNKGSRKKVPHLKARPLRPYPPPKIELNGHRNFFLVLTKVSKLFWALSFVETLFCGFPKK